MMFLKLNSHFYVLYLINRYAKQINSNFLAGFYEFYFHKCQLMQNVAFILLITLSTVGILSAQKLQDSEVYLQDSSLVSTYNSELFQFKNINKTPYYRNSKALKRIESFERQQSWEEMYPALFEYVSKFGIANFYTDTRMLWRLAKLTEMYGDIDDAKQLYRLVLKHNRDDIDIKKVELYYDSLTKDEQTYYVPVEYYYELVDYRREVDTLRPPRGVLLNMGTMVNSNYADYGPTLSDDDGVLIFTSKRNFITGLDTRYNEDLFYAKKFDDFWESADPFGEINTIYNEGSASLSKNGKTLYFARCDSPDTYGDCDLFVAVMQADSTWGEIQNLGSQVNSNAWDSHPSLSHTEDTLYFASDRLGGFGLSDIYFTYKDDKDEWTQSQNLGPIINTRGSDVSPFYHHLYDVLYFSSNGQNLNFGGFDIYKSYISNYGTWEEPQNIGPLVNGPGSEFYFTIDKQSQNLYYARSTENNINNLDLYSFPLPMEAQPLATTKLTGKFTNEETGLPYYGIVSIIDLENGIEVAPQFLRPDGSFEFHLINNANYLIVIQGDEFFRIAELFKLEGDTSFVKEVEPIHTKIKFQSVVFGNGESNLTPQMYADLDKISDFLIDHPDFKLTISGHTDSDGREEFNLRLSQERADAIKEYIVYFGLVQQHKIEAIGYGSSQPIVQEISETDKQLNRRVEFELFQEIADPESN